MDDPTTTTGGQIVVREVEPPPSQQIDPWLYRLVVGILGAAILGVIVSVGFRGTTGADRELLIGLITLAGSAVGGLVGMLVPSPSVRK
jgi:hypothetical protein